MTNTEVIGGIEQRIEAVGRYSGVVSGLKIHPENAVEASKLLLEAWQEPMSPIYDPTNYDMYRAGKMPEQTLLAVPFVLALGGLYSRRDDTVDPGQFGEVTATVEQHVQTFRMMSAGVEQRMQTVKAARHGLAIVETFGALAFLGKNKTLRKVIKKSDAFSRRELREIL